MLAKVFEHFCNNDLETANDLLHKYIVSVSRDLNEEILKDFDKEDTIDGDMENDLANDLQDIESDSEENDGFGDVEDATQEIADELGVEGSEVEPSTETDETAVEMDEEESEIEEVEERVSDLEDDFEDLKAKFEELLAQEQEEGHKFSFDQDEDASEEIDVDLNEGFDLEEVDFEADKSPKNESPFSEIDETEATPVEIMSKDHKGFKMEQAPESKTLSAKNRLKNASELYSKFSKKK